MKRNELISKGFKSLDSIGLKTDIGSGSDLASVLIDLNQWLENNLKYDL